MYFLNINVLPEGLVRFVEIFLQVLQQLLHDDVCSNLFGLYWVEVNESYEFLLLLSYVDMGSL